MVYAEQPDHPGVADHLADNKTQSLHETRRGILWELQYIENHRKWIIYMEVLHKVPKLMFTELVSTYIGPVFENMLQFLYCSIH